MSKISFKDIVIRDPKHWAELIELLNEGWAIYWDSSCEDTFYFILSGEDMPE